MSRRPVAEGCDYKITLTHKTGCHEWDNVRNESELDRAFSNLKEALKSDIKHYEMTGRAE